MYALLDNAYFEDGDRVVLKLDKNVAPYNAAVFPLVRNKPEITNKAKEVFTQLVEQRLESHGMIAVMLVSGIIRRTRLVLLKASQSIIRR